MKSTAKREGGGYRLNGTKIWITNASVADAGIIFAYTDRAQKHRGISAFYVELNQPGVGRRDPDKLGALASPTGELTFDNVHIAQDGLIGREGEGFKICMPHLNHTRLGCAAGAVGLARAAREAEVGYPNQREQFGQKIGQYQMNPDLIIDGLKGLKKNFLQSLFVQGRITNADPDAVGFWLEKVREIRPLGVQIYTLESEPADKRIEKVSVTTLQWIGDQLRWRAGVPAVVF